MTSSLAALFEHEAVRRAIVPNFGWAIHVSPEVHLSSIRQKGLIASRDAWVPEELKDLVPDSHILCMHPLGAKLCPPPVCNTIGDASGTRMVTFAVETKDIPQRVHVDWSYSWEMQKGRIDEALTGEEIARQLITAFGSFVSYDTVSPDKLRVFCEGTQPANPASWPVLSSAQKIGTYAK